MPPERHCRPAGDQEADSRMQNRIGKRTAWDREIPELSRMDKRQPDRLASYIWQAHPDSVEMIVDEMVAIREEIAAWREKIKFREVYEA